MSIEISMVNKQLKVMDNEEDLKDTLLKLKLFGLNSNISSYCEECGLPFEDYGYNPILIAGKNDKSILRELCDLCAANYFEEDFVDNSSSATTAN